ncbi:30S ribosomal protein S3 [Patescibacteria group bacterium]|nr:30S ribosomal protein S3 [Patescibacteria group bacterium]
MGQKTNALGFRLQINKNWKSRWYCDPHSYADQVLQDLTIRRLLTEELKAAGIVRIEIERTSNDLTVDMRVARPGVVIGKGGKRIEELKRNIRDVIGKEVKLRFDVKQIRKSEVSARLLAEDISRQLERRGSYKRIISKVIEKTMDQSRIAGIEIVISGRLNGVRIARTEKKSSGSIPMQTISADIDYYQSEAQTKYGLLGVKVWLHKKEIDDSMENPAL